MIPNNTKTHGSGRKKTICTSAVLEFFGIHHDEYHYSENANTVKNVLRRKGFSVRSRKSLFNIQKNNSIGKLRISIREKDGNSNNHYYVGVVGHAMVLNGIGQTIVDTAPRKRDKRKIIHISIVEKTC